MGAAQPLLSGLVRPDELRAAARSGAYRLFAEVVHYPDEELVGSVSEGALVEALRSHLDVISPELAGDASRWSDLAEGGSQDALAIEYTRLFETGAKGPPCPLYGGLYGGARMKFMEEAVRFYNHFGLTLSETPRELPDHLATQLEFVHYLAYREAEVLHAGQDAGPFRRAQRDFLERQLHSWVPALCGRLHQEKAPPFYTAALELLCELVEWDTARLHEQEPRVS